MLVENSSWRWIYYIQIILMALALFLQIIFYKPPNFKQLHGERSLRRELMRVDYVGIFLLVAGLSMFLLGVSWGELIVLIDLEARDTDHLLRRRTLALEIHQNHLSHCHRGLSLGSSLLLGYATSRLFLSILLCFGLTSSQTFIRKPRTRSFLCVHGKTFADLHLSHALLDALGPCTWHRW